MNLGDYYELFLYIAELDIGLESVFVKLDENLKNEIFKYIKFLKTKPSYKEYIDYKISERAIDCFTQAIEKILDKIRNK